MSGLYVIGRALFGGIFLYSGINHFLKKEPMTGYAASKGLPQPEAGVLGSGALLAAAGFGIMFGLNPKLAAGSIAGFLAVATPIFHDFWNETDPHMAQGQVVNFSKNAALLGAALVLMGSDKREY